MDPQSADTYRVPAGDFQTEIKVKGSRFIGHLRHCPDRAAAEEAYARLRKSYYNATHNCFAYRIDDTVWRYSDDGEPNGTAGKPILQEIEASGLEQVLCVVTRYFGGTKLGTGGLIRAYGEAARKALAEAPVATRTRSITLSLRFPYELESSVRHFITVHQGRISASDYSNGVLLRVDIPQSRAELFKQHIDEAHLGRVEINPAT